MAEGETVNFDQVLARGRAKAAPRWALLSWTALLLWAKVIKNGKGKKLNIITYRPKKGSARRMGHRQPYTKVEITEINA